MRGVLLIALAAIGTLYVAGQRQLADRWAGDLCDLAGGACSYPRTLLIAAGATILTYVLVRWSD